jgi:hypothetical protein
MRSGAQEINGKLTKCHVRHLRFGRDFLQLSGTWTMLKTCSLHDCAQPEKGVPCPNVL